MHDLPLQDVLRRDRVELRLDQRRALRVDAGELIGVERGADAKQPAKASLSVAGATGRATTADAHRRRCDERGDSRARAARRL